MKLGQGTVQTPAPPPRRPRAAPHCGPAPRCHPVLLSPPSCTTVPGFDPRSRPGQDGPATSPLGPPGPESCQYRAEIHHLSTMSTSCICKTGLRDCGRWTRTVVSMHPEHTQQAQARLPVPLPKGQPGFHRDKPTPTSLVTPPLPPVPQSPRTLVQSCTAARAGSQHPGGHGGGHPNFGMSHAPMTEHTLGQQQLVLLKATFCQVCLEALHISLTIFLKSSTCCTFRILKPLCFQIQTAIL